jgi:glycine betaine/proline transport system ATP-binding protein
MSRSDGARATKISVREVTKIFGKDPRRAKEMLEGGASKADILRETGHVLGLNDVSFDVAEGEIFVVMGLSGSGKSTLIRCLNRLYEPTSGQILVDEEDVVAASRSRLQEIRRTKMSMVFQHFGLFPHKSVLKNVAYGLKVQGVPERERLVRAAETLDLVGLAEWGASRPANLSGGMQQRVGLARALCTDPDILLMDEAFSALDPLIRRQMQDELLALQERVHKTIVFITHDLNEALRVGNRVAIMQDGVIVQIGTPTEIVTKPATQYVAEFMADVDQSRVLDVGFAQQEPRSVPVGRTAVADALATLPPGEDALYAVDADGRPVGLLMRADLTGADPRADVSSVAIDTFPAVPSTTTIAESFTELAGGHPVAVTGESGRLDGVVWPLDVLEKLGMVEVVAEQVAQRAGPPSNGSSGDNEVKHEPMGA